MEKVCVTGGAGFIGSALVRRLLDLDREVVVIDDFSTGQRDNIRAVEDQIELVRGDIRSEETLREGLDGVQTVLHQAALPSVPRSMQEPVKTTDATFMGTVNLLEMAVESGVDRVVYASSSSVYGNQPGFPRSEDMHPAPESPYAASKASCEYFGGVFARQFPIQTVGLRYFNVFGPRQDPAGDYAAVVPSFITNLLEDRSPVIYGDGEQSRDFTYVKDVVQANLKAAQEGENGRVYNVAYGQKITVNSLFQMIREITGKDIEAEYEPPRPGDVRSSYGDERLFKEDTGFQPGYTVKEGLTEAVQWYQNNPQHWRD